MPEDDIWPDISAPAPASVPIPIMPREHETEKPPSAEEIQADQLACDHKFQKDLLRLTTPIRSGGDCVAFALICFFILCLDFPLPNACMACIIYPLKFVILGFVCSYLFQVIICTADHSDFLPPVFWFDNIWDDVVRGAFLFFSAALYTFAPALILSVAYAVITGQQDAAAAGSDIHIALWGLVIFGVFFWPMVMLVMAWGDGLYFLKRPDQIIRSILPVWKPYLKCWLALLGAGAIWYLTNIPSEELNFANINLRILCQTVLLSIVKLAAFIYAMRIIGLLYRHYHQRLIWWQE